MCVNSFKPSTFVKIINETDFHGVSGHLRFLTGPSRYRSLNNAFWSFFQHMFNVIICRVSTINVVQWLNRTTHVVGVFRPNISTVTNEIIGGMYVKVP